MNLISLFDRTESHWGKIFFNYRSLVMWSWTRWHCSWDSHLYSAMKFTSCYAKTLDAFNFVFFTEPPGISGSMLSLILHGKNIGCFFVILCLGKKVCSVSWFPYFRWCLWWCKNLEFQNELISRKLFCSWESKLRRLFISTCLHEISCLSTWLSNIKRCSSFNSPVVTHL